MSNDVRADLLKAVEDARQTNTGIDYGTGDCSKQSCGYRLPCGVCIVLETECPMNFQFRERRTWRGKATTNGNE